MKFGNFVGKENIKFTNAEIQHFKYMLNKFLENNHIGLKFTYSTTSDRNAFYVEFSLPKSWIGRAKNKRRITLNFIHFCFYKQKGYLEIYKDKLKGWSKDNVIHDTENAPNFQYECFMGVNGSEIRYRGRNKESILVTPTFTYGTEFSDMENEIKLFIKDLLENVCYNRTN